MRCSRFVHLLIPVFVGLGLACGDNPALRQRFEAERLHWEGQRLLRQAQAKPESARLADRAAAADHFEQAVQISVGALAQLEAGKYPDEIPQLQYIAFQSALRLSQLHFGARRYDSSAAILKYLLDRVDLNRQQAMTTRYNLGQSLQSGGQWDSALAIYDALLADFYPPVDDSGRVVPELMDLPFNIWRISRAVDDGAAPKRLASAEQYYKDLVGDRRTPRLERAARHNLAKLYDATDQFDRVLTQLNALLDPSLETYYTLRLSIADILAIRMERPDTAILLYTDLLNDLGPEDTLIRPRVLHQTALARMQKRQYDQARQLLVTIKRDYPFYYRITPSAQWAMAETFENQGNFDRAETEYRFLIEKYRGSEQALAVHLHLADHYENLGRTAEASRWRQLAAETCQELAIHGSSPHQQARALFWQARLAQQQGDWAQSAEILTGLFERFPDTEVARRGLLRAADIYRNRLDRPGQADSLMMTMRAALARADIWPDENADPLE